MKVILVDDEREAITYFQRQVEGIADVELIECFEDPIKALNFVKKNDDVDAAIIDVNMPEMDGITLALQFRMIKSGMLIMFITAEESSSANMIRIQPDSILFKPYIRSEIERCLKNLTYLCKQGNAESGVSKTSLYFRTFGRFEMFMNGKICPITNKKVKELIALFVESNGGMVSSEFAISRLWEDREYDEKTQSLYRVTVSNMRKLLQKIGVEELLIDYGREKAFDVSMYSSDFQAFLNGDVQTIQSYNGEFMSNYSWAENTVAMLDTMYYSYMKQRKGVVV